MSERIYPVRLTAREVDVLHSAGCYYEAVLEDREDEGDAQATRDLAVLSHSLEKLADSGVPLPFPEVTS